jgi:hypothetical protein
MLLHVAIQMQHLAVRLARGDNNRAKVCRRRPENTGAWIIAIGRQPNMQENSICDRPIIAAFDARPAERACAIRRIKRYRGRSLLFRPCVHYRLRMRRR